jgi:hypothetical protein
MKRREFLESLSASATLPIGLSHGWNPTSPAPPAPPNDDRARWVALMTRLATPVLTALASDSLRELMPVEERPPKPGESRRTYSHLEAFGRLMAGITPWLTLPPTTSAEEKERARFNALARQSLENAVNPETKDHMNFSGGPQPLVDAAFLALSLARAPGIWGLLDNKTRENLLRELRSTRSIRPYFNNWLLFSAMIESFFCQIGEEFDRMRIDYALRQHEQWYKGDGLFGDGPDFHWDYYNSYVIQPFLRTILDILVKREPANSPLAAKIGQIASRFAVIQEHLIAPDGSFPPIGRSLAYRCGAFHHLANEALRQQLPSSLPPGQVRAALTAVIKRTLADDRNYDANGWLLIGLNGHQPQIGEGYISTGSLYLAATAFLPLGLPEENAFWSSPAAEWTSQEVWKGKDLPADEALKLNL